MDTFTEDIYGSNVPIKYVFEDGKKNKDQLIIVFSDFSSDESKERFNYDYIDDIKNVDCNKLFILDNYGPKGCYYLGIDSNFEVETSVMSLISYISNLRNIPNTNMITIGTFKGASAALYYGLKYNMGNIIVGDPHIKIADFVRKNRKETADYLLGFKPTKLKVDRLNNLIFNQLNKKVSSKISILSSDNAIKKNHTDLLIQELDARDISVDYSEFNEDDRFYEDPAGYIQFLQIRLATLLENINIKDIIFDVNHDENLFIKVVSEKIDWIPEYSFRVELKDENEIIRYYELGGELELRISHDELKKLVNEHKFVSLNIVISRDGLKISDILVEKLLIGNDIIFKGTELTIIDNNINFFINMEKSDKLEYAFYLRNNNKILEKVMYDISNEVSIPINSAGKYQVQYFIRDKETTNKLLSGRSKVIVFENI
jgi:hypothetical protein